MSTDVPSVVQTAGGNTVVYRNRNLYSPTDPLLSATRRAQATTIPARTLVLVPSPLLGHGISELLHRCGPHSTIVLIELESALDSFSRQALPQDLQNDPRILYCSAQKPSDIELCLPSKTIGAFERAVLVRLNGGYNLHTAGYQQIFQWMQDEIRRSWQNRMTALHMGRLWFRNLMDNLAILPFSTATTQLKHDKPVLVVGAGPSLEPLLPELSALRTRFVVMAVDTALPVLAAVGIEPDVVVAVEAQHANLSDFLGIDPGRTMILADLFSFPAAIRRFRPEQRLFFCSRPVDSPLLGRLKQDQILPMMIPPLGSVGVVAVYLARSLYTGPIAFCGLDFAYPDGKTHARGAPWIERELRSITRLSGDRIYRACLARPRIVQPDKNGVSCKTDVVLLSYAEQLRALCAVQQDIYDLGNDGLPTGAPRLDSLRRVPDSRSRGPQGRSRGVAASVPPAVEQVRCALKNERRRIAELDGALSATLDRDGPTESMDKLATDFDYVLLGTPYRSFADRTTRRAALAGARFFAMRIDRAIARLG